VEAEVVEAVVEGMWSWREVWVEVDFVVEEIGGGR